MRERIVAVKTGIPPRESGASQHVSIAGRGRRGRQRSSPDKSNCKGRRFHAAFTGPWE